MRWISLALMLNLFAWGLVTAAPAPIRSLHQDLTREPWVTSAPWNGWAFTFKPNGTVKAVPREIKRGWLWDTESLDYYEGRWSLQGTVLRVEIAGYMKVKHDDGFKSEPTGSTFIWTARFLSRDIMDPPTGYRDPYRRFLYWNYDSKTVFEMRPQSWFK